jgi:hypothetical protein
LIPILNRELWVDLDYLTSGRTMISHISNTMSDFRRGFDEKNKGTRLNFNLNGPRSQLLSNLPRRRL